MLFRLKILWYNFRSRCQRFKRGYADADVWNMNSWFIDTIKPMLIQLRECGCGTPANLSEDEWHAILDEMINCLHFMNEDHVYCWHGFVEIENYKRITTKDYEEIGRMLIENKNRFFELFNKYFYDLWD